MALPMLMSGSDCGPSNPLQGLVKHVDQDRGLQQDFFGAGRSGSSKDTFRRRLRTSTPDQEVIRFFGSSDGTATAPPSTPVEMSYDMSAMQTNLPTAKHAPQSVQDPVASWAMGFMQQQPFSKPAVQEVQGEHLSIPLTSSSGIVPQGNDHWAALRSNFQLGSTPPNFTSQFAHQQKTSTQISWDKEFNALDSSLISSAVDLVQQMSDIKEKHSGQKGDDLARSAGILLESVKHEQNPKFKKSQFMGLMKSLRDGEVVVEGNKMVESDGQTFWADVDIKGKEKAFDDIGGQTPRSGTGSVYNNMLAHANGGTTKFASDALHLLSTSQQERDANDANDAYFRQDNDDYIKYWNEKMDGVRPEQTRGDETKIWDNLQDDWDNFEAITNEIKPMVNYQFMDKNPYLLGDSSKTNQHTMHLTGEQSPYESFLELEAVVQRDPESAGAWYELGVKQQENEREHKALQALERAIQLDPSHLPAWLALAISYTNYNNCNGSYNAIRQWVDHNEKYKDAVKEFRARSPEGANDTINVRCESLIQCLMVMARDVGSGEVDADIQIAMAVLLNSSEDYRKAQDCFSTALAVRPNDWLLYNRVGATVANSGRAGEALNYYYRALELNPTYIRARFNLGISCINLRRYEEAGHHILDALLLQDAEIVRDADGMNEKRGVTSESLWDTLRTTSLHMQRADLANLCDHRDIEGFRKKFRI